MRSVKIILGVVVIPVLLFVCCGWVISRRPLASAGEFYLGPQTKFFLNFVQDKLGLSERDAVEFMHKASRQNGGTKIIDRFEIPPGADVDFIEVDGSGGNKTVVRYLGSGRVFPAFSPEGIAFWRIFERAARRKGWDSALRAMADLRQRGIVIAPAWFGSGARIAHTAASTASSASSATNVRIAIICARFPMWRDRAPRSDGDGVRGSGGDLYYEFDPSGLRRHVDPRVNPADPTTWQGTIDWYIDSPGGVMPAAGGEPTGPAVKWDDEHPERAPSALDGPTTPELQNYWYRRIFDLNFTGGPGVGGAWPGSLTNYYWDNSHGNIRIQGQPTDIYGWFQSHHILDRQAYPRGPGNQFMIQPGTPLIRPSDEIIAADGVGNRPILRASLTGQKLTILYRDEFMYTTPPMPTLEVWQPDIDSASGNQPGMVTLDMGGGKTRVIRDPYDARRWTYVEVDWEFTQIGATSPTDFAIQPGQPWRVTNLGYTWQAGVRGYQPQDRGCGALPNTLFTRADVALQRDSSVSEVGPQNPPDTTGNRLKSFDYYCHDHFLNTARGPYQLEALYHGSYRDDIGGETDRPQDRKPRPYPFDCGMPSALGGSDQMQLGYFHYPNNNNDGDHSAGAMRADVNKVIQDWGVTISGYDRVAYVFAGQGVEEGQTPGAWGTIIAHAGGGMVTVGEDASLTLLAHELGHTFGMGDLYDMDFYVNALSAPPPNPKYFECSAMGPYSVMAMGGVRVDAWHKIKLGWLSGDKVVALTQDRPNAQIPAVEGVLREPIVYKLPASPYYITDGVDPDAWQEYFLVEYRDVPDAKPTGYYGDQSPQGVYIYHIDERGVGQTEEGLLAVSIVEADASNDLQINPNFQWGNLQGDPFPGSSENRNFCQWNFNLDDWLNNRTPVRQAPRAYSHGLFNLNGITGKPQKIGDTEADSFTRVLNITLNGPMAYADIYVRPREVVALGQDAWADRVDADGTPDRIAWQGLTNVPVLRLVLRNERNTGPGDYVHMSTGDVTIERLRVLESGSSPNDSDITLVKVWADSDNNGLFDAATDTLLSSGVLSNQEAILQDLNYEVPLGEERGLFITYDISPTAQINPKITVGADFPEPRYIWPKPPGTVQERVRTTEQFRFGAPRFPIQSPVGEVLEGTDTVFISSSNLAPNFVAPNDKRVPVLRLLASVDRDRAIIRRLRFLCNPDAAHTPSSPQKDVELAELWIDANMNGAVDPTTDRKIAEAVFSNPTTLLFDGLNLTLTAGTTTHLIVSFNISGNVDLSGGAHWLELELPTWVDDRGTPDPSDDVYYVTLVDEDGPNNTLYGDPAQPGLAMRTPTGSFTTVVAGQDVVDVSGAPWKSIDFAIKPPTVPVLTTAQALDPLHGTKSTVLTFRVRYTSSAGLRPAYVRLVYRNEGWPAARPNVVRDMLEVDPADRNYMDGKDYVLQLTGLPDWGTHKFYFTASDGYTQVWYYDPEGPSAGNPAGSYETEPRQKDIDAALTDWLLGPIIGVPSAVRFTDGDPGWNTVTTYEEGRDPNLATARRVYVEVTDPDENEDSTVVESVVVTITGSGTGADSEVVQLQETDVSTGVFRGSVPTIGRAGAADDGWLNVIAGPTGQDITVSYIDADDVNTPVPASADRSQAIARVVDTTPPAQVLPLVLTSSPQGRALTVNWAGYDEAAQIDVARYNIYWSTTDFNSVAGLTPGATRPAGTTTYTITGLEPDTDYFVIVTAVDEVPNELTNGLTSTRGHTTDTAPPVIYSADPYPRTPPAGATGIGLTDRTISAYARDTGTGIDVSDPDAVVQFDVQAENNGTVRAVPGALALTGGATFTDVIKMTWTANQDWQWNDVVTVTVKVKDRAGNQATATWKFYIVTDKSPPAFVDNTPSPARDATGVAIDEPIRLVVEDGRDAGVSTQSDLNLNTLSFAISVVNRGNQRLQQAYTFADSNPAGPFTVRVISTRRIEVTYRPQPSWLWNDVVTVTFNISDNAGNALPAAERTWAFNVVTDLAAPTVSYRSPDDDERDVPIDAVVTIGLRDMVSGLDLTTLRLEVRITNRGHVTQPRTDVTAWANVSGTINDSTVTFDPKNVPADQHPELANGWTWNDVVTIWLRIADRAGNVRNSSWTFYLLEDLTPPAVDLASRAPAADETQVGFAEPISFDITDDVSGVDEATLQVQLRIVNRGVVRRAWSDITGEPGFSVVWTPDFLRGSIVYEPQQDWQWNDVVSVRARATDRAGNAMGQWQSWTFYVLADTDELDIIPVSPLPGATGVSRDTNIVFRVVDGQEEDQSGIVRDSIALTITVKGQVRAATFQIEGDDFDYVVTYDPVQDFVYGDVVECTAEARDNAGNRRTKTWTFTIVDDVSPPTITPILPVADATDVPVDTNVVVSITDTETGVDERSVSVELFVDDSAVPGRLTTQASAGGSTVTATFDPTNPLPHETRVRVKVSARDGRGNQWAPPFEYYFTTRLAPRYMIVGRVTQANGAPIAAVNIQLAGAAQATTQTDGNGYYRFDGLLAGAYTVTPSLAGWTFTPTQRQVNLQQNVDNVDFRGRQQTFVMSGSVATADGAPLQGVTIQVNQLSATTDAEGKWRITGLTIGDYTITPSFANYRFDPASRTVRITEATTPDELTNLNFRAVPFTFSIAGVVTDYQGNRMDAVRIVADSRTAVTNETGRYQLGGIPTGTVQVRVEKQGWSFLWQDAQGVWHRGAQPVTVPPDQTAINFVGYPTLRNTFSTGVHFIGVPATPYDPAAANVFGTQAVARWDPAAATPGYVTPRLRPDSELLQVRPGRGFFVRFTQNTDLEVLGVPPSPDSPINIGLAAGWNMQANPFDATLPFGSIRATSGDVRAFGYVYDAVRRSYLLISATPGVGIARSYLLPWEGIWLRALTTASVEISPPTETSAVESVEALQANLGPDGWWIPISARAGDAWDECCAVGVTSSGTPIMLEKPPALPNAVDVSVMAADGTRLSRAVQVSGLRKHEWDVVVSTDIPNAEVSVSLPDLSRLPHEMTVTLTDLATGKTMYARTMSSYRFQVGPEGGSRKLRLVVEPRSSAGLVLSSALARSEGARVVVTYSVSAPCRVQARVLNIAGRPVRVLASDSTAVAGVNTLSWDGRNSNGSLAPSGLYLIELEAVAENGQRAKAVTQVRYAPPR